MRSMRLLRLRWLPMRGRWNTNKCLKYRLKSNSQGIVYVDLSCQGVRVVVGVRTFFRIFVLSTCPYPERQKHRSYAIIFSNHPRTPVQAAQYWIYVIDRTRYVFFEYLYQKSYDYDNILPCYSSFLSISALNSFIICIFALNKAIQSWQNNSSYEQYSISNNRSRVQAMGNS